LTVTVAVIFSGVYLYLNRNLKEYAYQRIKANLSKQASFAKVHLEEVFDRSQSLEEEINTIAGQVGKSLDLRATIIGLDGKVLGDSELEEDEVANTENHLLRPEVQDALKTGFGESRRFSTTVQKDMLYEARLFGKGFDQGLIRLAIPLSEIQIISDKLKKLLLFALFFAFLFTIMIGSTAFIFVSKPIAEISTIAQEIAKGNYSRRVSISTNDEIGDLSKSINYMSEQISTKIGEVISNKSRFEAVLLSMCEGTMVVDKEGAIILMNDVLSGFFQVHEKPLGRKILEVVRNIDIQEIIDKVLRTKAAIVSQEISILAPEEKVFQVYAAPVLHGKELDGAVLVFHEITELRRLENVRRDFIANVSHEIRTPLTSIKGYAETLLDGAIHDKKNANDFLKIISLDSNRLVQLVDDLLDLSTIESGKLSLRTAPHSLESIVDRVMAGVKEQSLSNGVTLRKDIPQNISKVNVDDAAIAQVLLNLLNNGIKYNKKDGSITISAHDNGNFVRVDISDTGIGIPEEDIPRIFERFYRVDKARSRELGGTGLGLSIVKHIIQAHNGEVFVVSELEKGSTFSFTLPKS
jgi:two-component system phosphate regulon sensor histidine kinase PhoR